MAALLQKIAAAKEIESFVRFWIQNQSEANKKILLTLSIGRIIDINRISVICKTLWALTSESISLCIKENKPLLTFSDYVKFNHPSFKTAILDYFKMHHDTWLRDLIMGLITQYDFKQSRVIYKKLIFDVIDKLDVAELQSLILTLRMAKNIPGYVWFKLIQNDYKDAIEFLRHTQTMNNRIASSKLRGFFASIDYMDDDKIKDFIAYLFSIRKFGDKLIDTLIAVSSYGIRDRVEILLSRLDDSLIADLKLKLKLLGAIGSKYPERVFERLKGYCRSGILTTRVNALNALKALYISYDGEIKAFLESLLLTETEDDVIFIIKKSIAARSTT